MVRTSDEAGRMYCFMDPVCRSDVDKVVENARKRFSWIWKVDLGGMVEDAEREWWVMVESMMRGNGGCG